MGRLGIALIELFDPFFFSFFLGVDCIVVWLYISSHIAYTIKGLVWTVKVSSRPLANCEVFLAEIVEQVVKFLVIIKKDVTFYHDVCMVDDLHEWLSLLYIHGAIFL